VTRSLRTLVLGTSLLVVLSAAAAGQAARSATSSGACLIPPQVVIQSIKETLKAKARGKLGKSRAVKSRGQFTFPRGLRKGVYFVSAKVGGFGIATWAASASEYKTGGGLLVGVGAVARRISDAGIDLSPATLSFWGLTTHTHGYAESRGCL
jgi:hypothetical protein